MQPVTIADYSETPQYAIKAVSVKTGIRPVTLRAWERRYELLSPYRSYNRYRLYSDREIAILCWIRARLEEGKSISSAVSEYKALLQKGVWPEAVPIPGPSPAHPPANPPAYYAGLLMKTLIGHDEAAASDVLREAHALFDLTTICLEVIIPCLVEIGEAWHRGEIRITDEHYASAFLRGKMLTLLQAYTNRRGAPLIIIGCAPSELHEIGSLILAVLLRRDGLRVEYLGPDIPLEDLVDYARFENPALIILSASLENNALELENLQDKLAHLHPAPLFGYGGRAFTRNLQLRQRIQGIFLGETLDEALKTVHRLLNH